VVTRGRETTLDAASCGPAALAALDYIGAFATVTVLFRALQELGRVRRM